MIIVCQFTILPSQQQSTISLNNAQWFLSNSNNSIQVPAQVPGGVYSDLRRNNVLKQDILQGKNDLAYRWVSHDNWTYTTAFAIDHQIARSQSVKLVLDGIDTISTIFLNDHEIGTTENMFVRYKFDIKPHLKLAGLDNILVIKFESPLKYSARRSHQSIRQNRGKIIPPYCPSPAQRGECHVNFIRKMQASFSWDWGPAFPSMGIYKNIKIEFGSFGIIRDILVETKRLSPLIQTSRPPQPAPSVIISSSIRHQLKIPTLNRTVPYMRAPPYYMAMNSDNQHLMLEQPEQVVDITRSNEESHQLLEENWLLKTTLVAEMVQPSFGYNLRVEFNLNGVLHYESEHINVVANSEGYIRLGFNLRIDTTRMRIKPWWPNNAGTQTLYKLSARMMPIPNPTGPPEHIRLHGAPPPSSMDASSTSRLRRKRSLPPTFDQDSQLALQSRARPPQSQAMPPAAVLSTQFDASTYQLQYVSSKEIFFGFRTVELIQEPVTRGNLDDGLTFNFRINGADMFAMGSNWIPASVLPEYSNDLEYIRYLLQSAKDANMNMLRVWGGGLYESDEFYQMADEMGIMIWHDFMFACALYPVDEDFLSTIRVEIEQQVQRLQYHPSIVLWAGNNENEMAIAGPWWAEVMMWNKKLRESYAKLYVDTIRPIVQVLDPTRPYVESSPSNGLVSESQPNAIARVPNDNKYGDVHHYDYFADSFEWTSYPNTRFASEYGFQSYPSFNAMSSVTSPADWKYPLTSNVLHRQHRLTGETEMKHQIKLHFREPQAGGVAQFKNFLYLSQLTQAIAIKTETEFYRRNRFIDPETKLGKTMGALYWQLNDVWSAPTWSSIEYGGKWKMLHYFARRFFFPIQVMPYLIHPQPLGGSGSLVQHIFSAGTSALSSIYNRIPSSQSVSGGGGTTGSQQQSQSQQQDTAQQPQPPTPSPILVVDLIRDDMFHLLDSFNVTIRFYRWTSFAPVWQDTVYVKHTRPQNVTRIYEQDISRITRQPGVISISSGVFQVTIEQQPRLGLSQIENYLLPVVPTKITAMRVARISVELIQGPFELTSVRSDAEASQWACAYRLTLVSDSIAMFVWLDLNLLNAPSTSESPPTPQSQTRPMPPLAGSPNLQSQRPPPAENTHLDALPPNAGLPISAAIGGKPPDHIRLHLNENHPNRLRLPADLTSAQATMARQARRLHLQQDGQQGETFDTQASGSMPQGLTIPQPQSPRASPAQLLPDGRRGQAASPQQVRQQHQSRPNQQQSFRPVEGMGSSMLRYQFSDNAFNMLEQSKVIDLYLSKCLSRTQVEVALEVQSLADIL